MEKAEIKLELDKLVIQQGRLIDSKQNIVKGKDMLSMIKYGANEVLGSKDSAITDETIDAILEKGEARTVEIKQQLEEFAKKGESSLQNFTLETPISVYDFEGEDYRKKRQSAGE